jgi:hypothetical protein
MVVVLGVLLALAILFEVGGVNGPWYWKWPWRNLGLPHVLAWMAVPMAAIAWGTARAERISSGEQGRAATRRILALLTGFNFLLQLAGLAADSRFPGLLRQIVESPAATSYYGDALRITDTSGWLAQYATLRLGLHSATHPPGPILFYRFWIVLLGPEWAPGAGAVAIGILAALGVPVFYLFARTRGLDRRSGLLGACLYAQLPALILFFPEFDQVYPLVAMAMLMFWERALRGKEVYGFYLGAVLFLATMFAYNLLLMGVPMVVATVLHLAGQTRGRIEMALATRSAGWALSTWFLGILALAGTTGYAPLKSFVHALEIQSYLAEVWPRPLLACILFAPYDFFCIGGIFVAAPLVLFAAWSDARDPLRRGTARLLARSALLTILLIDVSGLLRAEVARIWGFLQPLVLVPAAVELADASAAERWSLLGVQGLLLAVLKCKMSMIEP